MTATPLSNDPSRPAAADVATVLLRLGSESTGAMNYVHCTCDEAATILEDDPSRLAHALEVVRLGLKHAADEHSLQAAPELMLLAAAETVLERAA